MITRALALLLVTAAAAACGLPRHDGYPRGVTRPWDDAVTLQVEGGKLVHRDRLSWGERRRAIWLALDLPDGARELALQLRGKRRAALRLELLTPQHRVLGTARSRDRSRSNRNQDGPRRRPARILLRGLAPGRYLVHLYVAERHDATDVTLSGEVERGIGAMRWSSPDCVWSDAPPPAVEGGAFNPYQPPAIPCLRPLPALP